MLSALPNGHPVLAIVSACMGIGTFAQFVAEIQPGPNPNLAAIATICGALATIFSAVVAKRNSRRKPRPQRDAESKQPTKKPGRQRPQM